MFKDQKYKPASFVNVDNKKFIKKIFAMDRVELSNKKFEELFGKHTGPLAETDQDMQEMLNRFIFSEVFFQGDLSDKL